MNPLDAELITLQTLSLAVIAGSIDIFKLQRETPDLMRVVMETADDSSRTPAQEERLVLAVETRLGRPMTPAELRVVLYGNTFTRLWEMEPYEKISREVCGMEPLIWRALGTFESTHQVPTEKMEEMAARFEHHPREHLIVPTEITE